MERRRPHLRSSGAWSVYNLVPDFVQTALRCTWSCVWHAASSLGLGSPPSEASGPPGLCVAYEGGDAPEPTLAPSYPASRSPGHPGKCDGSDVPDPFAETAQNRIPPQVYDQRFFWKRRFRVVRCDGCHKVFSGSGKGSFVKRTCAVSAGERRRLWAMGQLDGHWYCLECWAVYAGRPLEEMSEYLGWAGRDAKRMQYVQHHNRRPQSIAHDDERFSNPSLQTRLIFCDYPRCMKPCKGVQSGYFLTANLPARSQRQALWESGSLDMRFYCQRHYEEVTGRAEPEWAKKRREDRARHRHQQSS